MMDSAGPPPRARSGSRIARGASVKADSMSTNLRQTVRWTVVVGAALVVSLGLLSCRDRSHVAPYRCLNNLKQIGIACRMYAQDHGGLFPTNFVSLSPYVGSNAVALYRCPWSPTLKRPGSMETVDQWTEYRMVQGLTTNSPPGQPNVFCIPENHKGEGWNVLYVDGHVEWANMPGFAAFANEIAAGATNRTW